MGSKDDWYRNPSGQHKDRRSGLFTRNWGIFIPSPLNEAAPIIKGFLVNWKGWTCWPGGLPSLRVWQFYLPTVQRLFYSMKKFFCYSIENLDRQHAALLQWKSCVRSCVSMEFVSLYSIRVFCICLKSFLVREKPTLFSSLRSKWLCQA